jgi:predicted nucleic acid-binding protein
MTGFCDRRDGTTETVKAASDFAAFDIERYEMTADLGAILALRDNFTVCDAAYVVLAQQLQSPLVTRDAKLADARRIGVVVELF